ncbi:hypothetical protein [Chitinophaga silvisoli]|uniref:Uncharacterized protein n=1 Tax=Chitinophaga silvisoli TaxID=2291814 RepID=A0A3E1P2Q4_9BACT|nr:hypothetical protein [Chitinophaga silvisoli]RFM34445.1 hypothetical protein DXN04_14300 [Chitinophaga silvisoli]
MNRKKKVNQNANNENKNLATATRQDVQLLNEMFSPVNELPIQIRNEIAKICDWSLPTYYRKLSGKDKKGVSLAQLGSIADIYLINVNKVYEKLKSAKERLEKLRKF